MSTDAAFFRTLFHRIFGYRLLEDSEDGHFDLEVQGAAGLSPTKMDGALGWFDGNRQRSVHVVVEMKRPSRGLDESGGSGLTPVQQAWDYANRTRARWIIVSNFKEIRLYCRSRSTDEYERFLLADLLNPDEFRKLWLLLHRDALLPVLPGGRSGLDDLLDASAAQQAEITDRLYRVVAEIREGLFDDLGKAHSNLPRIDHVRFAQKILDRFIFLAFAEDRGLIPKNIVKQALDFVHPTLDVPKWEALVGLCRRVDLGDPARGIPRLNGGLFAEDPELEALEIPDAACERLRALVDFDFADDVSVEVLGHIFEQSINDLESMRALARGGPTDSVGGRKKHGVFYTPSYVTRYLTDQTLQPFFEASYQSAVASVRVPLDPAKKTSDMVGIEGLEAELAATRTRVTAKAGNQQFDLEKALQASKPYNAWLTRVTEARKEIWVAYQRRLRDLRVLDPACGSGAFLAAAFDRLAAEYHRTNREIEALGGNRSLFDVDTTVLQHNLFGVDLNPESVQVTKLSLWLKTATRDRPLTWLDGNIQCGDSLVDDPRYAERAFDWKEGRRAGAWLDDDEDVAEAIDARWKEGFDVVLGNPPYVRQEWFTAIKPALKSTFDVFDGTADLFVYFFERGLQVLKPGGRLAFIVSNKWMKGGYAARLRAMLASRTVVEEVLDFGHAPIFPDADAFPSIVVVRKLGADEAPSIEYPVRVAQLPRKDLGHTSLPEFVQRHQTVIRQGRFGAEPWSLESPAVQALMDRMTSEGVPLREFAGCGPMYGIKTGFNDAFMVDTATRDALVREDPRSAEIIRPYLRGQDIDRWASDWNETWLIFTRRGVEIDHYPAILRHLERHRAGLEPRPANWKGGDWPGRKPGPYRWYEIQDPVAYHEVFAKPKLVYQVIQFHPSFALDTEGRMLNDKGFCIPTSDPWLLAHLNSAVNWWFSWRYLVHLKDEALSPLGVKMEALPVPDPTAAQRDVASELVPNIVRDTADNHTARRDMTAWLKHSWGIEPPGQQLQAFASLSTAAFLAEVQKRRPRKTGRLGPADVKQLTAVHREYAEPWRERDARIADAERRLCAAVVDAWKLTPAEVELIKKTAPLRTPPGLPV